MSTNGTSKSDQDVLLWTPKPENVAEANMTKFRELVNKRHQLKLSNYQELYKWSVENVEQFWTLVWEFTNIIASEPPHQVLEKVSMADIPKWFEGAKLNFAENLLMVGEEDATAIIATGEAGDLRKFTYGQLREHVRQWAAALIASGVKVGDRVAAYIPNCEYAMIGMLAATSIGAIWSSTSPDFGPTGVLERFSQIKPKIFISINAIMYNGKEYDHLSKVQASAQGMQGVEKVVVIPYIKSHSMDISNIPNAITMDDFLKLGAKDYQLKFEQLPFYHPVYILFSSGTTGTPKCLVHSGGGSLIQHKKELMIHSSFKPSDVFFYYTTTGWMMWNWLSSALSTGCTIVLYDGSPFKPTNDILWKLCQDLKFTVFGTSAKYIQSCQDFGLKPGSTFDLSSLHTIFSTGSPLSPESFEWVYKEVKSDVLLGSISGGTDIVSLFVGHNDTLPVYKGEIQCRCLGMAVEAWDHQGKPCYDQDADLVCVQPFPCMPVEFWGDDEKKTKYKAAYFDSYPGVWGHGDFVRINSKTGGVHMLGRSDGTLNPSGVRFGSAEIYNIMARFPEVADSLCVGQKRGVDERVILFCKMQPGKVLDDEFRKRIAKAIREELSPRHVPEKALAVTDIPYTLSGKKVEVAIKKIISNPSVKLVPSGTIANPESLEQYYHFKELQD